MLKVLLLRKKLDAANKALEALRAKEADFAKREAEIEAAINEAADIDGEDAAEAQKAVEEEVDKFEADKKENDEAIANLENEIAGMEKELADAEEAQDTTPAEAPAADAPKEERKVEKNMFNRNRFFRNADVDAIFTRDDVKAYMNEVRSCIKNKRELTNVGLTIPEVFIGLIKENVMNYSKLYRHVNVQAIGGNGREIVQGTVSEAIWTECCANLNELSLAFNDVEVDCYKVGGYYKVCNAVLEDNDVDLATKLLEALSQAIGLAIDKAILYGRNSNSTQKMPQGIVSRLVQTSEPANYPATARTWVDLHTSNIKSLTAGLTGTALFKAIILASGAAKSSYSRGAKTWVMNETTYTKLMAEAVNVNGNGQMVAGLGGVMPVVGGDIEVLNFIPDNTIIGGYFDLYLLGERAGAKFAQSEHVFFLGDATAFKGTARYDGQPVIAEAFVAIGLEATTPDATMTFAPDEANTVQNILLSATAVSVDENDTVTVTAKTIPVDGAITWTSSDDNTATVDDDGVITGVASGTCLVTATSGGASASVAVTVTT